MKVIILTLACTFSILTFAQNTSDIFRPTDFEYTYMGIDYSHAKFIGEFSQFESAGNVGISAVKDKYFEGWNGVVKNEKEKYSFKNALRKDQVEYNLSDITSINNNTAVENMEGKALNYSRDDIQGFVNNSAYTIEKGIGIMFIAEYLDKEKVEACFHFVMVNLASKEILIHERMIGEPRGFGLRNYWISPVYQCLKIIDSKLYKKWRKEYLVK